jgi:SAM-dependent methyltransferase
MNCPHCEMYRDGNCAAWPLATEELRRPLPPAPLGSCMLPIVQGYLKRIQPGMKVLDIGCGSWSRIRDYCNSVGASYEGIDVDASYFGVQTVATRLENLANLSFENEQFDLVISNQSMEHWGEFGCSLRWGLYQCFRVCRTGGHVCLNVPIYFHGTTDFMLGRLDRILAHCLRYTEEIRFEKWGQPSGDIPPYYPFPGYWRQSGTPAYILDIQLRKTRAIAVESRPRFSPTGRVAQVLNYPLSFNFYRVWTKILARLQRKNSMSKSS